MRSADEGRADPKGGPATSRLRVTVITLLFAAALAAAPALACAAPSPGAAAQSLQQARARAAEAEKRLSTLRSQLATALDRLEDVDTQLEAARFDQVKTEEALEELDDELSTRQFLFDGRVISVYKSGGYELLEAMLNSQSLDDLFTRMSLLAYIQQADDELLTSLTSARDQQAFLQQQKARRSDELAALKRQAEVERERVDAAVAEQKALTESLGADVARLVKEQEAAEAAAAAAAAAAGGTSAPPVPFDPNLVITDGAFLDWGSMSAAGVQAFLDGQPGALKWYSGRDHAGRTRTAAQMIADAAAGWGVSPKAILVTLQKEQSLISNPSPSRYAYDWAMGCGKTDSKTYTQYQGFGNQIWGGAQKLRQNRSSWKAGISLTIDGSAVSPANASTHSLYRYTPHFKGVTSFWRIWWRYFGDPLR